MLKVSTRELIRIKFTLIVFFVSVTCVIGVTALCWVRKRRGKLRSTFSASQRKFDPTSFLWWRCPAPSASQNLNKLQTPSAYSYSSLLSNKRHHCRIQEYENPCRSWIERIGTCSFNLSGPQPSRYFIAVGLAGVCSLAARVASKFAGAFLGSCERDAQARRCCNRTAPTGGACIYLQGALPGKRQMESVPFSNRGLRTAVLFRPQTCNLVNQ